MSASTERELIRRVEGAILLLKGFADGGRQAMTHLGHGFFTEEIRKLSESYINEFEMVSHYLRYGELPKEEEQDGSEESR